MKNSVKAPTLKFEELVSLISSLVKSLVDDPDSVNIDSYKGDSILLITIKADSPKTLSFLIGKNGNTVSAMRHIVRCLGARSGVKAVFEIASSTKT